MLRRTRLANDPQIGSPFRKTPHNGDCDRKQTMCTTDKGGGRYSIGGSACFRARPLIDDRVSVDMKVARTESEVHDADKVE